MQQTSVPLGLTPRQTQAISATIKHGRSKVVARILGIDPKSVEGHLAGARSRAGVETTAQLAAAYVLACRDAGVAA